MQEKKDERLEKTHDGPKKPLENRKK